MAQNKQLEVQQYWAALNEVYKASRDNSVKFVVQETCENLKMPDNFFDILVNYNYLTHSNGEYKWLLERPTQKMAEGIWELCQKEGKSKPKSASSQNKAPEKAELSLEQLSLLALEIEHFKLQTPCASVKMSLRHLQAHQKSRPYNSWEKVTIGFLKGEGFTNEQIGEIVNRTKGAITTFISKAKKDEKSLYSKVMSRPKQPATMASPNIGEEVQVIGTGELHQLRVDAERYQLLLHTAQKQGYEKFNPLDLETVIRHAKAHEECNNDLPDSLRLIEDFIRSGHRLSELGDAYKKDAEIKEKLIRVGLYPQKKVGFIRKVIRKIW